MDIALSADLVHIHAAGIGEADGPCHLVKTLAGSVVPGASDDMEMGVVLYINDMGVTARHHQTQERRFQVGVGDVVGGDVSPEMVHRNQGLAGGGSQTLGKANPHQQGADESRGGSHSHGVDLREGEPRVGQRLFHYAADIFGMTAGGNLRHNTAIFLVFLDLGIHHR